MQFPIPNGILLLRISVKPGCRKLSGSARSLSQQNSVLFHSPHLPRESVLHGPPRPDAASGLNQQPAPPPFCFPKLPLHLLPSLSHRFFRLLQLTLLLPLPGVLQLPQNQPPVPIRIYFRTQELHPTDKHPAPQTRKPESDMKFRSVPLRPPPVR